jgi:predicted RNA-binding protein YlxR (DUF448 family)
MATKHTPIRTCIGTGEKKPKNEMIRLVRREDGSVVVDVRGREKGRGANISMDISAFDLAVKKRAIGRALKLEKSLNQEQLALLRQQFLDAIEERKFRQGNKPVTVKITREQLAA